MTRTKTRALANWPNNAVSVLDFGAVGDGVTVDDAAFDAALASIPESGGTIYVPSGDYRINFIINKPNVKLVGDQGTVLRPSSNKSVIEVYSDNVIVSDFSITGQLITDEGKLPPDTNVTALHGIRVVNGTNVVVSNIQASGFRQDCLYISSPEVCNIVVEKCFFDGTARNTVSVVDGWNIAFRDCVFKSNNKYLSSYGNQLFLVDIEPFGDKTCKDISFDNCDFIGESTTPGADALVLTNGLPEGTHFGLVISNCRFPSSQIRPRFNAYGMSIRDSYFNGRPLQQAGDDQFTVYNSVFENLYTNSTKFTYRTTIGDGCSLQNIHTSAAELEISGVANSISMINVDYNRDTLGDMNGVLIGNTLSASGGTLLYSKSGTFAISEGQTILTITSVDTTQIFQTWEVIISAQCNGSSQSRRQRSTKLAFMITCANGNQPVVDLIPDYGWPEALSGNPAGGDRDPSAFNPTLSITNDKHVVLKIDVGNSKDSGSNKVNIYAQANGSYLDTTKVG